MNKSIEELQSLGYAVEVSRDEQVLYVDPESGISVPEDSEGGEWRTLPTVYHVSGHGLSVYVQANDEEGWKDLVEGHEQRTEEVNDAN